MKAHLQEESKLWSFVVLFQKQIMNVRRRSKERNLTWRNSRGQKILDTFRAVSGVHFMHTICRFKAREVRSPTLQTVHKSELKWRSYGHWKQIAPSWKAIPQAAKSAFLCEIETFSLRNFVAHVACCEIHLSTSRYLWPTLLDFFFRYLLFKSPFSPYNPPIIGFFS